MHLHVFVIIREAALSSTDCTESEPEVVPGSGVVKEDRRPRMVPQMKGHHVDSLVEILHYSIFMYVCTFSPHNCFIALAAC